jgi:hypothetical protein
MTTFDCVRCEEQMSDYLENALSTSDRVPMELHLNSCQACSELLAGMGLVMDWGKSFPVYEAPSWLPTRIIANTPRVERETWLMTTVLMIGWLGSVMGISADVSSFVRNPAAVYYRAYDQAVRSFYRAPVVTEIRSQIERLREIS